VPVPSRPATLLSPGPVTVLSCPVVLSSYSYLLVPSSLVIIPVPPFLDSVHTALSSYRPVPLFISYFPVSHCSVPPCPVTVLSQSKPSYPELKATYIMKYTLSFFHVLHLHIESVVNGISSLCEKCQSNFFFLKNVLKTIFFQLNF